MNNRIERINAKEYLVAEIDASKGHSYNSIFIELSIIFSFPNTNSANNPDALLDSMRDLSWLKYQNFKLIVVNNKKADKLELEKRQLLPELLESIREYWKSKQKRIGNEYENDFIIEFST